MTAAGLGLSACAGADQIGTLAHQVHVWATSANLSGTDTALAADVARIQRDRRHSDPKVVQFNCITLRQDAVQANAELITPDQTLSLDLSNAYDAYYSFAADCISAGGAPGVLAKEAGLLTTAGRDMAAARARLASIEAGRSAGPTVGQG